MHEYFRLGDAEFYWIKDDAGRNLSCRRVLPPGPPLPEVDPIPFEDYPGDVLDEYLMAVDVCDRMNLELEPRGLFAQPVVDGSLAGPRGVVARTPDPRDRLSADLVWPRVLVMVGDSFPVRGNALALAGRDLILFGRPLDESGDPLPLWAGQRWLQVLDRDSHGREGEYLNRGRLVPAGDYAYVPHDPESPSETCERLASAAVDMRDYVRSCAARGAWSDIPNTIFDRSRV